MNAREQGFLLLTGYLGDPERRPLTVAQFRELTKRARAMEKPEQQRDLQEKDLLQIGCDKGSAGRILRLLEQTEQLQWYLEKGKRQDCVPVTRVSDDYPDRLRLTLGLDAPGVLWTKGDVRLLSMPAVALVGSRDLQKENRTFAQEVGKQAALQGYALVSGDARGADQAAQDSCLEHGGWVISAVPDALEKYPLRERVLYIAEEGYDLGFSAQRALQRNRIIHCLGQKTFVAQCNYLRGGTWDGTRKNLHHGWSPVFCYKDASSASSELERMGAVLIRHEQLLDISALQNQWISFMDQ